MSIQISVASRSAALLGEGACWSEKARAILWVDIKGKRIFCQQAGSHSEQSWSVPEMIGCVVDNPDGSGYLAALQSGFAAIHLPKNSAVAVVTPLVDPEPDMPGNRFNDGAIDPDGNFWAGSMDDAEKIASGSWWRLDRNGDVKRLLSGFLVTNGPVFSANHQFVFLTDSAQRIVYRAGYDRNDGAVNPLVWCEFGADQGYPDGMSFGPDGLLWIAFWEGQCIRGLDENGVCVRQIDLPVRCPTKIAFAPDGKAYVTSASLAPSENSPDGQLLVIEGI